MGHHGRKLQNSGLVRITFYPNASLLVQDYLQSILGTSLAPYPTDHFTLMALELTPTCFPENYWRPNTILDVC